MPFDNYTSTATDPRTGRPYAFSPSLTPDGGWNLAQPWNPQGGGNMPAAYEGTGDGPAQTGLFNGAFNYTPEFLQSIGFNGNARGWSGGDGGQNEDTPEFRQFMQDRGLRLGISTGGADTGQFYGRAFDASGNPVGSETSWDQNDDPGNLFLYAMLAAGGFAGAAAAGVGAVGAGAAGEAAGTAGGGAGISAESAAYGALENGAAYGGGAGSSLTASAAPGFGGALGAEAGGGLATGATNAALAESAAGTAGYGASSAGLGGGLGSSAGIAGPTAGGAAAGGSGWLGSLNGALGTDFTGTQVLGAGASLANGLIGSYSAGRAADQLRDATNSANALQQSNYQQARADWAPYRQAGTAALGQMTNLLNNPSSVLNDPGVAFQQQQGQQQLDRSAAARGGLYSGAQIKAGARYNQDYASTALDRALSRYGNVAQIGATGTQGTQAAGTNMADQIGNNTTALGSRLASASLYQGNTWNNALNGAAAQFNGSTYYRP